MVVIGIVAVAAALTPGYPADSRKKGADTAIKSNLSTIRAISEIFYLESANSYLPPGGAVFGPAACPNAHDPLGTNMFSQHKTMSDAVREATNKGVGSYCANSPDYWAVAVGLNLVPGGSWCVDNQSVAKLVNSAPSSAINPETFACN